MFKTEMSFPSAYTHIIDRVNSIKPIDYGNTRNFKDGAVTRLSPYIARGVISTKQVLNHVINSGYRFASVEKFIQELAWRDYWQQIWRVRCDTINLDIPKSQSDVKNYNTPVGIIHAQTGIDAIDNGIFELLQTGYMHNHMRMYVASLACNIGKSHWLNPARWMYYHLLDGDWASNALSWQWVVGIRTGKKYVANQQNINKYFYSSQTDTFLDVDYPTLLTMQVPSSLKQSTPAHLKTNLPTLSEVYIDSSKPTLLYNYYNLDPKWHRMKEVNRILLIEPSIMQTYPISQKCIDFMLELSANIADIQVFIGEFQELKKRLGKSQAIYKEHPLNSHYLGNKEPRDWMFSTEGDYRSFFAFWKKCKKEIKGW